MPAVLDGIHRCQLSEHHVSPILQARYGPDVWKGVMDFIYDADGEMERLLDATNIRSRVLKGYSRAIESCSY